MVTPGDSERTEGSLNVGQTLKGGACPRAEKALLAHGVGGGPSCLQLGGLQWLLMSH